MRAYRDFYADGRSHRVTGTECVEVVNPATEEAIGEVQLCSAADLDSALHSARDGFEAWSSSSPSERQDALRRLAQAIEARSDGFVLALAKEIGCPVWLGRLMQVPMALKDLELTIEGISQVTWSESIGNGVVERVPVGVVGAALPVVLRMSMANSGQACVSQSRLIAPRQMIPEIEERLVALARQWPLGDPHDEATRLGPVATASQFKHVDGMINGAAEQGAKLLCGGGGKARPKGWFVAPTIFGRVTADMRLAQQEVFGPVLAVMACGDEEDAVRAANSTPYGLSGAVWSRDLDRAARVGRRLRTGQVVLNGAPQNLATPFGGWGQSGFGRENGRFGIEECLQYRSLHGLARH